jgi:hypothetical protein
VGRSACLINGKKGRFLSIGTSKDGSALLALDDSGYFCVFNLLHRQHCPGQGRRVSVFPCCLPSPYTGGGAIQQLDPAYSGYSLNFEVVRFLCLAFFFSLRAPPFSEFFESSEFLCEWETNLTTYCTVVSYCKPQFSFRKANLQLRCAALRAACCTASAILKCYEVADASFCSTNPPIHQSTTTLLVVALLFA